jgi:cation transport ATPase
LDTTTISDISAIQADFSSRGQRVLLLAKNDIPSAGINKELFSDPTLLEDHLVSLNVDLVIVGLVALVDPPRHDTSETVRVCRRAGIRFTMVTGMTLQQLMARMALRLTIYLFRRFCPDSHGNCAPSWHNHHSDL